MTIVLSIAAALSGVMIVGPLASYEWSKRIVKRTLSSCGAVFEFWSLRFKQFGGVMALLLSENPNWPKPQGWECKVVIASEYETYRKLRYQTVGTSLFFGGIWCWASLHFSFWILFWFVFSALSGAIVNRDRGSQETLVNIFRAVRLWMWASPQSLDTQAEELGVAKVVEVLRTVEPSMPQGRSQDPPGPA